MLETLANLHFLRPWWFLALIPLFWIVWRIWIAKHKQGAWNQVIEPKFRYLLLGKNADLKPSFNEKLGYLGFLLTCLFMVIALSGPSIKSIDIPAQKSQQGVVVVLDLSLSMYADDTPPTRLSRVKYTLTDLLKQNPEFSMGMVAYAGSAHTISPISEDNVTLLNLLSGLSPNIMPKFGAKPLLGLEQAHQLLQGAHITQGHIIWITDDIETNELDAIEQWIDQHSYSISLLTVGTKEGGAVQIPGYGLLKDSQDKVIMPNVPLSRFEQLQSATGIEWSHLQIGKDNAKTLLPEQLIFSKTASSNDGNQPVESSHPLDIGFYFTVLILPFVALLFRRGILLSLLPFCLIPTLIVAPNPAQANTLFNDFISAFKSQDQQGYEAWERQEYEKSAQLFHDSNWRASALYKLRKYDEAATLFALDKSAIGYFNLGNALTHSGQFKEAVEAYNKALSIKPNMTKIKDNLSIAKALQKQQIDKSKSSEAIKNASSSETDKEDQQAKNDPLTEQPPHQEPLNKIENTEPMDTKKTKEINDSTNNQTPHSAGNQNKETARQPIIDSAQSGVKSDRINPQTPSEQQQAQTNWLNQIPDEPGRFLKQKFDYQYQQNPTTDRAGEKQW